MNKQSFIKEVSKAVQRLSNNEYGVKECVNDLSSLYDLIIKNPSAWEIMNRRESGNLESKFIVMKPAFDVCARAGVEAYIKEAAKTNKDTAHGLYDMMGMENIETDNEYLIRFIIEQSGGRRTRQSFKCYLQQLCQNCAGDCGFMQK